jgi:hypothetical protein
LTQLTEQSEIVAGPSPTVGAIISDTESEAHSDVPSSTDDGEWESSQDEDGNKLVLDADFGGITFSTS